MTTEFLAAFGQAVRRLRQERGMTQAELAERLSLARTSITNLEKGQQNPPLSLLPEMAAALGVSAAELVATAAQDSDSAKSLAATVHDEDLRRWAGQLIRDTLTTEPSESIAKQGRRRPA